MTNRDETKWRVILVGGQAAFAGKTQWVADVIAAFPKVNWIAGRALCEPEGGAGRLIWEDRPKASLFASKMFEAGAKKSFELSVVKGAEGIALGKLRSGLLRVVQDSTPKQKAAVIVESDCLIQAFRPSLYFAVLDSPTAEIESDKGLAVDRANALVLSANGPETDVPPAALWLNLPVKVLRERPSVVYRQGQKLPAPLESLIYQMLDDEPAASLETLSSPTNQSAC